MKTIKGIFGIIAALYFIGCMISCAPSVVEHSTKVNRTNFYAKKSHCPSYGAGKRGTYRNYGM